MTARVPKETIAAIQARAKAEGTSRSNMVRALLDLALARRDWLDQAVTKPR